MKEEEMKLGQKVTYNGLLKPPLKNGNLVREGCFCKGAKPMSGK